MAVKQLVPIQFGGGINTKVDPKQLQAGELLTLQNAQFTKTGQLNKRPGYNTLNTTIEGGGQITEGAALTTFKNELIQFDGSNLYSYLPATGNWINRGVAISVIEEDTNIIRQSSSQQINPDFAYLNGMELYAWEDSSGGVRYSVLDTVTGAYAVSDALVSITGAQPKCIAFQNQIVIIYTDATSNAYYQTVNPLNPTVITAPINIILDGYDTTFNGFAYDAHVAGTNLYIAYMSGNPGPTGSISAFYLDPSFTKSGVTSITGSIISYQHHGAVSVSNDSNTNIWISWCSYTSLYTVALNYSLSSVILPILLISSAHDNINTIVSIESNTVGTMLIFDERPLTAFAYDNVVAFRTISILGVKANQFDILGVGNAAKPFKYNGNIFATLATQSPLQSTDFTFLIANNTGVLAAPVIIAKETPSIGGGFSSNSMVAETVTMSAGIFKFANNVAGSIISEANTIFTLLGVSSSQLNFSVSDNFISTTQDNTLLVVGGILQGYDGINLNELGFHLYPEYITCVAGGVGNLSTGTYQYMVEYQWTDNNGQIYRSAPSIPVSVQVVAGQQVVVSGINLQLTSKLGPISIVISRTAANGTSFNAVTSILAPLLNVIGNDTWTFIDTLSDTDAASNEIEYTTGGVLANIAPPANSIIATYGDRVFLAGMADKLLMWYSQTVVSNANNNTIPPQFCAELTFSIDPRGGDITALGLLNNILIIFKESNIFALQGNGPDATGNNSDYGDAQMITSDVGCIDDTSVVIMPSGLMFQSAKGIYLLDQSLNVSYIGAPVEQYNSASITSATLNYNSNQVIFTTNQNGIALVYDYYMQQWATWTNHYAVDACIYNGNFCWLNQIGQVYQQNTSIFTDNGSPIYMSWTMPNLSFAGIQGYQRVYKMYILGTYKGPHTLNVQVAYDYNDSYTQFVTVNPSLVSANTWGSDNNWGNEQFWGGVYSLYEFRIDFSIQKCTSIRINVSDNQSSNYNEGYAISSIVFEVGVMPGGNRLPTSSTYGTT